jgi:hypothetical protein
MSDAYRNLSSPVSNRSTANVESISSNIYDSEGRILYRVKLANEDFLQLLYEETILASFLHHKHIVGYVPNDLLNEFHHSDQYIQFDEYIALLSAANAKVVAGQATLDAAFKDLATLTGRDLCVRGMYMRVCLCMCVRVQRYRLWNIRAMTRRTRR